MYLLMVYCIPTAICTVDLKSGWKIGSTDGKIFWKNCYPTRPMLVLVIVNWIIGRKPSLSLSGGTIICNFEISKLRKCGLHASQLNVSFFQWIEWGTDVITAGSIFSLFLTWVASEYMYVLCLWQMRQDMNEFMIFHMIATKLNMTVRCLECYI